MKSRIQKKTIVLIALIFAFLQINAQSTINGKVISSSDSVGIPGVTIMIEGTELGVETDFDGNFELSTNENPPFKLKFSFIGFKSKTIGVTSSKQKVNVSLEEELTLLDDIVITARKRQEPLQFIPIAITAFSGKTMEELGVQNAGDIANLTPNFTWNTEFGNASPQPYLRGIGTNNFAPINNGPIAV